MLLAVPTFVFGNKGNVFESDLRKHRHLQVDLQILL